MAVPYRFRQNLDGYLEWLADFLVNASGGYLDTGGVDYLDPEELVDEDGEVFAVTISQHRLRFYDGTSLHFSQLVTADCEVAEYSYHYMRDDGSLIARVCKNTGHERETGGSLTHLHLPRAGGEDRVLRASEYDFDDAVELLRAIGEATRSH